MQYCTNSWPTQNLFTESRHRAFAELVGKLAWLNLLSSVAKQQWIYLIYIVNSGWNEVVYLYEH